MKLIFSTIAGDNCDVEQDACRSNPCSHFGTCVKKLDSFECDCDTGFEGKLCEVNIDDCLPEPCKNGGTCVDGPNSYSCECSYGFIGMYKYILYVLCTLLNIYIDICSVY